MRLSPRGTARFMLNSKNRTIPSPITGYHLDEEGHWVAQLECGHNQHVRHDPPLVHREWVLSEKGRRSMLGFRLNCKKCLECAPSDARPPVSQECPD
ncbi:MAG: DUF3565 domain-containing protein [Rhodopirellula sp. JB044]|uniref:DUF3565 domain-containing protein n=1 Tax=Rhodopirellula sp. JB044 TaxID=3342844 RepID=UPI003709E20F